MPPYAACAPNDPIAFNRMNSDSSSCVLLVFEDMDKIDVVAEWDKLDLSVSWLFMIVVHEV